MLSLCRSLGITNIFLPTDFTYLQKHIMCTHHFVALLGSCRKKLKKLTEKEALIYCRPLAECLLASFEKRFETFLNLTTPES